jgi:nicotinamidase-related amidase
MFDPTRPYEPLTSENAALVLVDHQVGLMIGVRDYSTGELKHNVVALAKAAKALKLPIILTTTARDSMWGPTFPELVEALPGVPRPRPERPDCVAGHVSNSEISSQIIPLKARADSQDPSRIAARETTRV